MQRASGILAQMSSHLLNLNHSAHSVTFQMNQPRSMAAYLTGGVSLLDSGDALAVKIFERAVLLSLRHEKTVRTYHFPDGLY
jgi:hypothetical protein